MTWLHFTDPAQISEIEEQSKTHPVVVFKHSTRCSISAMAKVRLEKAVIPKDITFYYLDIFKNRPLSNLLSERYHVHHESPQILLIKNAECVYDESHNGIIMNDIAEQALNA